ncbi:MAG: hypothetical protein ACI9UA_000478 [Pseudoalteromonas tetraodonis]|jgi:hypothetical protein
MNKATNTIQRGLQAASVVAAALALSSCEDEAAAGASASPATPSKVATSEGMNMVEGDGRSKHFDAVASHLHVGGSVFAYMDVDGDVEKLAGVIQNFLKGIPADQMPPHIAKLDLAKLLDDMGLGGIEAMGMSSFKNGDLYHNRAYMHVPDGRKGFLKMFGGDAAPFVAGTLAPVDSDLVMEQTINLAAAYEVVSQLIMQVGGDEAYAEFRDQMSEVNPQLGLSMANLLGKLDTRLTFAARVHPDKPLEIPDAPMPIPSFDFLVALDDVGWLYEKVTGNMKAEMPPEQVEQLFVKGDGFEKMSLPPLPSPEMAVIEPVVHHDIAGKRVYIASSQAYLDECLSGKTKLNDSPDFKAASAGLPTEGNGLSYVSADFMKAARKLYEDAIKGDAGGMGIGTQEIAIMSLVSVFMPKADSGQAKVSVNEKDGIFVSSNSTASMKEGVIMSSVGMMAVMGTTTMRSSSMPMPEARAFDIEQGDDARAFELPTPDQIAPAPVQIREPSGE